MNDLWYSNDLGAHWRSIPIPLAPPYVRIESDPENADHWRVYGAHAAIETFDAGATWAAIDETG